MFDAVQETVDRLASSLRRSVVLENSDFGLLASSPHFDDIDPARLHTLTARRPSEALDTELRSRRIHTWLDPSVLEPVPWLGIEYPRLAIALRSRYEVLGFLWVTLLEPLTPNETDLVRETAETLRALLINASQSTDAVNAEIESEMLGLLAPDAPSRRHSASELVDLGMFTRSRRFVALCLSFEANWAAWGGPPSREVISRALLRAITTPMIDAYSFVPTTPEALILIGFRNDPDQGALESIVASIIRETDDADVQEPLNAVVGVGASVVELADTWASYEQALVAVRVARSRGTRTASWGADSIAASIATLLADEPLGHLLPEPLRRLASAPDETIQILEAYVAHGARISDMAEQLGVHRSTVHYRLRRVAASIGIDIEDAATRFVVEAWLRQRWFRP